MNSPSGAQHHQRQEPKMLLGKRPRPPPPTKSMRRTTSMGGIVATVEPDIIDKEPVHPQQHGIKDPPHDKPVAHPISTVTGATGFEYEERLVMSPSSSSTTTIASTNVNYPHVTPTPHFLRTCGLCKRALAPGRDIYMYRGNAAFCSLDCREKQMRQDERKDQKLKVHASNKQVRSPSPPPPSDDPTNTKSVVTA